MCMRSSLCRSSRRRQRSAWPTWSAAPACLRRKRATPAARRAKTGSSEREGPCTCRAHAMHKPWLRRLAAAGLQRTGGGVGGTNRRLGRVERG
eukprot:scaffold86437_cov62-Phaeocystis_antarctica.AAC.5